jgi:exodeoxyribonuclease-3
MRIVSWNVAGIRACLKRGSLDWLHDGQYDVVCFQETKATQAEVVRDVKSGIYQKLSEMYPHQVWHNTDGTTQRKGLSGTSIWSKIPFEEVLPIEGFDREGRICCVRFEKLRLLTVYTPNSRNAKDARAVFRAEVWDGEFRRYVGKLMEDGGAPMVLCGDFNVARRDIDVARPKKWAKQPGLLSAERDGFEILLANGFVDVLRAYNPSPNLYTYWTQRVRTYRPNNIGWRIDYFLVQKSFMSYVTNPEIIHNTMGSDHCPITLTITGKPHPILIVQPPGHVSKSISHLDDDELQLAMQAVDIPSAYVDDYSRTGLQLELAEKAKELTK